MGSPCPEKLQSCGQIRTDQSDLVRLQLPPLTRDESYPLTQDVSRGLRRYIFKNRTPLENFPELVDQCEGQPEGHTTMSPPWSYVNIASNVPVRESHIFKTSTEGRQLCKHARRWMAREAFRQDPGRTNVEKCDGERC